MINDIELYEEVFDISNEDVSLLEFIRKTSDDDKCMEFLYLKRYGRNNRCVCGLSTEDTYKRTSGRKSFQCTKCGKQIYPMKNTVFKNMKGSLSDWFYLMYNSSISKKNISAIQAAKNITINYETTHRIMKMIRKCMFQVPLGKFSGVVEIDEAFIGGGSLWFRFGSICKTRKHPILGFYERGTGLVKVVLIKDKTINTLDTVIEKHVELNSTIFTDGWSGYNGLKNKYDHDYVEHSKREYVREEVHTNNIENFWGIMKRNIRGAHTKIGHKYVQNYMDEIVWKFNHKDKTPLWRFDNLIDRALETQTDISNEE